jgi:hypothetical protein
MSPLPPKAEVETDRPGKKEQRKLDPRRQDLVRRIVEGNPKAQWGPKELQQLHDDLEAWGE